jgi:hypothetical protein
VIRQRQADVGGRRDRRDGDEHADQSPGALLSEEHDAGNPGQHGHDDREEVR